MLGLVLDIFTFLEIPVWVWVTIAVLCVIVGQYMVYEKLREDYDGIQIQFKRGLNMLVEPMLEAGILGGLGLGPETGASALEVRNMGRAAATFTNSVRVRCFDEPHPRVFYGTWIGTHLKETRLFQEEFGVLLLARAKFNPEDRTYSLEMLSANSVPSTPEFYPLGVETVEAVVEITADPRISKRFVERYVIEVDPQTGIITTIPQPLGWQDVLRESKLFSWWGRF